MQGVVSVGDLDFERTKKYLDRGVLITKDGRVLCTRATMSVFAIKAEEKAYDVVEIDDKTFETLREAVLQEELSEIVGEEEEYESVDDTEVFKLLKAVLDHAVKNEASDIHVSPKEAEYVVQMRIDGVLKEYRKLRKGQGEYLVNKIKNMSKMDIAQKLVPQDGKFSTEVGGTGIEVRVSVLPTIYGERAVMRIQRHTSVLSLSLEDLGFEQEDLERYREQFSKPEKMILNVGPTGHGKTTTFYATIKELVEKFGGRRNIITIEDPVEIRFSAIEQVEVNEKAGRTFLSVLRASLRQDPDVILIGEIRDEETASVGIKAAITGHLVLATLHATDAVNAIYRLRDLGVSPVLIASAVKCILSQRLVRKLCPKCKKERRVSEEEKRKYEINFDVVYEAVGCDECDGTGYKGRSAVVEVLVLDDRIKELISEGATEIQLKKFLRESGHKSLWDNALKKVERGETSLEEILLVVERDKVVERTASSPDIREVLYPDRLVEVIVDGHKGYVFDRSSRGLSLIFDEPVPIELMKTIEIRVGEEKIRFVATAYGRDSKGRFILGGKKV